MLFERVSKLLRSFDQQIIKEAATYIEDIIDDIDDHNQDASPCKDIVTVSEGKYKESFPKSAHVYDQNSTIPEIVINPEFQQITQLLQECSNRNPVIITSVRKSTVSDQLQFGKQYVVDGADKEGVRIHYEHEGNGDVLIPKKIIDILFYIRSMLEERCSELEKENKEICMR